MFIVENDEFLPEAKTQYSAGLDVRCTEPTIIMPHETAIVGTGVRLDQNSPDLKSIRADAFLTIAIRSSLALRGLSLANDFPVIDLDYPDEIKVLLYNRQDKKAIELRRGERIAQLILMPHMTYAIDRGIKRNGVFRSGGFGSTGEM